jgi:hypothetical protein
MTDTTSYVQQIRSWWTVILAVVAAAGVVGFIAAYALRDPEYRATTTISLSDTMDSSGNLEEVRTALELAPSYAELARSPAVLEPVIEELSLSTTSRDLRKDIRASVLDDTSLIQINVTANSKSKASDLATSVGEHFITVGTGLQPQAADREQLEAELASLKDQVVSGEQRLGLMVYQYLDNNSLDPQQDARESRRIDAMKTELDAKRDAFQVKRQEINDLPEGLSLSVIEPTTQAGSSGGLRSSLVSGFLAAAAGLLLALGALLVLGQGSQTTWQDAPIQPRVNRIAGPATEPPVPSTTGQQTERRRATDSGRWPG